MRKCDVRTPGQALAYITDCNMATVSSMAMLKSRKKHEYLRQIEVAQTAYDWMIDMRIDMFSTRADEVDSFGGSVAKWAKDFEA